MAPVTVKRYSLVMGENTYASPAATSPADARKLTSLISSLSGFLEREHPIIPFATSGLPGPVGFFHQFNFNASGVVTYYFFCATATTLYQLVAGAWVAVAAVGTLVGFPVAVNINNLMHLSDGAKSWIFDGTSWLEEGLAIPQKPPVILGLDPVSGATVTITSITRTNGFVSITYSGGGNYAGVWVEVSGVTPDTTFDGTFKAMQLFPGVIGYVQTGQDSAASTGTFAVLAPTILTNRYYWTTFVDQSSTHGHESSSSPISVGTGPLTSTIVAVQQRAGTLAAASSGTSIVGVGTDFNSNDVGLSIFVSDGTSVTGIPILSVTDAQHLTLASPAPVLASVQFVIAPARATAWNLYASSSEEDKIGNLLATTVIAQGAVIGNVVSDQSPMIGTLGSYFSSVVRPLLNDPPNPTTRMEAHENRIWRRDETHQNYTSFSAFEEVLAEQAGSPYESVPGAADTLTVATQDNEFPLNDQSLHARGYRHHGDSMYVGSEINIVPLYGSSLTTFQLSPAQAFAVGLAGKRAWVSTPFGLAFVSYDLKVYLYPSQYSFGVDSTTALVELGRPKRPEFETIAGGPALDQVFLVFYNWGRRNWLVLTYERVDNSYATWIFDFETKGWFQSQQGYTAVHVFEMTTGRKCLVGAAASDNTVYATDDLSGSFSIAVNATYPAGIFRDIIDFSDPNSVFKIGSIECETSDPALMPEVTIWLDPQDPENPGPGLLVPMLPRTFGPGRAAGTPSTRFSGRLTSDTGATCQRALVEFILPAGPSAGVFRGYTIMGEKIPDPVF